MNNLFAFLPMRVSNDLLDDADALRAQLDQDGYLYFEQLIDRERVRALRRKILVTLARIGWTEPVSIPVSDRCIIAPLREEDPEFKTGYQEIQKLEEFHALAHDEDLLAMLRTVRGPSVFPHPLKIARVAFPDNYEISTPPHQDFPNNQGSPDLLAAWIPAGDLTPSYGGLGILRGSHRYGVLPLEGSIGAGNRRAQISPEMAEECRWVTTEFRMGDVLVFPAQTVHAALHNASEFSVRLSVDFRYQLEGEALTPGCLEPHFGEITWEEIYAGWESTELQYYWKNLDFETVPFERMPIIGDDGTLDLPREVIAEVLQYKSRSDARVARRMEKLGITPGDGGTGSDS